MLAELVIHNIAIVERMSIRFTEGFNVLTGETGAGKSIVLDALTLALGANANPAIIRAGCEEATVAAVFVEVDPELLRAADIEPEDEVCLRRTITRSGRGRAYINDMPVRLKQLKDIGSALLTVHGQHEQQALQHVERHLAQLDAFAKAEEEAAAYHAAYTRLRELTLQADELQKAANQRQEQQDLLEFQCRELADAKLTAGEDLSLETERSRLHNAGKLLDAAQNGYEKLYGGAQALTGELDKVAGALEASQHLEPKFAPLAEALRNALYGVEDVALQLRDYARHTQNSPERLSEIEERLQLLNRLKRKYRATDTAALLEKLSLLQTEITRLAQLDETVENTLHLQEETRALLEARGATWSEKRRQAAPLLAQRVVAELADLAMPNARFEVRLTPLEKPGPNGLESGEFYFCANAGEELKPLAQIASGGELSRLMLAIYCAAPAQCGTLVFDEVDAGLGGRAGTAVGRKLRDVARTHQVLCVTHLPQVAACANQHWRIEKHEDDSGRTVATATHLEGESRDMEMARMLGGPQITATALANARELLTLATSDSLPLFSNDE